MPHQLSRRSFLKRSALLSASLAALPHARVLGANGDVRVAVIGFRSKGMQHIGSFKKLPGVRVVALCDVDSAVVEEALNKHFQADEVKPRTYTDVRKLLEDKDIDAVVIATPNHWHAPITIWACQAGKDVYVEKPCSHTIWEGQQMMRAADKYKRIVQVGMQTRSDRGVNEAFRYVHDGNLGPIEYARGIYWNLREPIGNVTEPQQPPPSVDYNLWLGPAPEAPLMRKNLHYDWHWQWPYGNGELGNNGVHLIDLATWALDLTEMPEHVLSFGGRFKFDDDGETANTHVVWYGYKPHPVFCEIRNLPRWKGEKAADNVNGHRTAIQIKCRDGSYIGYGTGGFAYDNDGKKVRQFIGDGGEAHHQNFIDAVRSRKSEQLAAGIEKGHLSAALCHLGNISHRLGEPARGAELRDAAKGNVILQEAIARFNEHLLMNHVDVVETPRMLGAALTIDPRTEQFTGEGGEQANAMLTKSYRPGFEIKEEV